MYTRYLYLYDISLFNKQEINSTDYIRLLHRNVDKIIL